MTWRKVIIFAIVISIYAGAIMLVPALKETSLQDIGISYEWWVIFAIIIVVNCEKGWEAMLKCFVFFLISQPLIYLVEIISGQLTFDLAWTYYSSMWLPLTFLTLPGGFIAYFCKKQNAVGAIILGLGNTIQALFAVTYFSSAIKSFPHHLISGIVCVVSIIVMVLCIQQEKRKRVIAFVLPVILTIVIVAYAKVAGLTIF